MSARILLVEDNPANLELMDYLLRAFGHSPLAAADGAAGLELAWRERPDLILLDVQMPGMDGYTVVRRIKDHPALRAIPVVAVTALAMVGDRDKVLSAGFDGYIAKPIEPQTFVPQVESFLPRREERPAAPAHAETAAPLPAPHFERPAGRGTRILVVDNSPVNISLMRSTLEPCGYEVIGASTVQEGLALARQELPDLIVSDLHMPCADGHDFLSEVQRDTRLRVVPFVFISSSVYTDRDAVAGLAMGAAKFIQRPIEPQALLAEIASCLAPNHPRQPEKGLPHGHDSGGSL